MQPSDVGYEPDRERLPQRLRDLAWFLPKPDDLYGDGDRYLAAVPVRTRGERDWRYELTDITVHCDEGFFDVSETGGDDWGWTLSEVDWLLPLN